jgi:hypothetical protein
VDTKNIARAGQQQQDPQNGLSSTILYTGYRRRVTESSFAKEKESNHVEKTRNVPCGRSYSFERVLVVHRRCRRAVSRRPEVPWHSFRRRQLDLRLPSIAGLAIMLQTRRGPPRLLASPIYSSDKALPDDARSLVFSPGSRRSRSPLRACAPESVDGTNPWRRGVATSRRYP